MAHAKAGGAARGTCGEQGGNSPPPLGRRPGGGSGGGGDEGGPAGEPSARWALLGACALLSLLPSALLPPAANAAQPSALLQAFLDWGQPREERARRPPQRTVADDIAALKRLQREAFAQLLDANSRLDALTPKTEEEEEIPLEGASVSPIKLLPPGGMRAKAAAKLTGTVEVAPAVVVAPASGAGSSGGSGSQLSVSAGPHATLLLQTLLGGGKRQSVTAVVGTRPAPETGLASIVSSSSGGSSGSSGSSSGQVGIQQLVYKAALGERLKVMVAAAGGSLQHIARRTNPFADTGLTTGMCRGHGLSAMWEAGTGAGATLSAGVLSLSAGHFLSPAAPSGGPAVGAEASGAAGAAAAGGRRHHTVAQLALHLKDAAAFSLVGMVQGQQGQQGTSWVLPGSESASAASRPGAPGPAAQRTSIGAACAINLADSAVLSGWRMRADTASGAPATWGLGVSLLPDTNGITVGCALSKVGQAARPSSRATTPRVASSGQVEGGASPSPRASPRATGSRSRSRGQYVAELSCKLPLADGVTLVPGLVAYMAGRQSQLAFAARSIWAF